MIKTLTPPNLIKTTVGSSFPPISNTTNRNTVFASSLPHQPRATLVLVFQGLTLCLHFLSQTVFILHLLLLTIQTCSLSILLGFSSSRSLENPLTDNPTNYNFHAWLNILQRKMSGFSLDLLDILTVMYENTTGKPRRILEAQLNIGVAHLTLENVKKDSVQKIWFWRSYPASIINMLDSALTVKSVCNKERMGYLIEVSHIIMANMSVSNELQIFNLSTGLRKV